MLQAPEQFHTTMSKKGTLNVEVINVTLTKAEKAAWEKVKSGCLKGASAL